MGRCWFEAHDTKKPQAKNNTISRKVVERFIKCIIFLQRYEKKLTKPNVLNIMFLLNPWLCKIYFVSLWRQPLKTKRIMKTFLKITAFSAVLLMLVFTVTSCNDDDRPFEEPKEVSFAMPTFWNIPCFWENLNRDGITIINSQEQMAKYLECWHDTIPQIDFLRYTLLVASGVESAIAPIAIPTAFYQMSRNRYSLEVVLCGSLVGVNVRWTAAALVPKISDGVRVELVIVGDAFSDHHACRVLFE